VQRIGRFWWVWALVALLDLTITLVPAGMKVVGTPAWTWFPIWTLTMPPNPL
jgi:hypothetical protein